MARKTVKKFTPISALILIVAILAPIFYIQNANAANLVQSYVRLDRLAAATPTSGLVCARPATSSAANVDVQLTIPTVAVTDFTVSATGSNWAATTAAIPSGTTAWPGIAAATPTISGHTVTWTYSGAQTLNTGTTYCFQWTNTAALTTGAAGVDQVGAIRTRTTAGAEIDSASYALSVISNDQIVVTATVPPTFSFSLSGNTDTFASDLSTAAGGVSTAGRTATIGTNARNGWTAWVRSTNAGLNSAGTGASIATAGTIDAAPSDLDSTTGYVLDIDGSAGVTPDAEYNGTDATQGGTLATAFQPAATAPDATASDTFTLTERARIIATQAAANDYTDTLTVVAAGNF